MIQVFLCSMSQVSKERSEWFRQCADRWTDLKVALHVIMSEDNQSGAEFQRQRRIYADEKALESYSTYSVGLPIYIVADDDCLPVGDLFVSQGLKAMERNPKFSILSAMPENERIIEWSGDENYKPLHNAEVTEHHSVGGIRFCRKGHMPVWPPIAENVKAYDAIHCEHVRLNGKRVGYIRYTKMLHLGKDNSTVWEDVNILNRQPPPDEEKLRKEYGESIWGNVNKTS